MAKDKVGYVDGFVIPIEKKKLAAYRKMAAAAGKVWKDHGALEYYECAGEDLVVMKGILAFPKLAKVKKGETVVFSWIGYKSRKHRDAVNKKVMKDPRILNMMLKEHPFDPKRMAYGGFSVLVRA